MLHKNVRELVSAALEKQCNNIEFITKNDNFEFFLVTMSDLKVYGAKVSVHECTIDKLAEMHPRDIKLLKKGQLSIETELN